MDPLLLLEKASGATGLPIVDGAWSGDAARKALAKWASSDGSGDKDKMNWTKYARGFFWYDSANRESFGAYKLPFATVRNGRLVAVRAGIHAAAAAVQGSRGGVSIPESELGAVRARIAAYYRRMGEKPPWANDRREMVQAMGLGELLLARHYLERLAEAGPERDELLGLIAERLRHWRGE